MRDSGTLNSAVFLLLILSNFEAEIRITHPGSRTYVRMGQNSINLVGEMAIFSVDSKVVLSDELPVESSPHLSKKRGNCIIDSRFSIDGRE
jgi:hypothetical protein